MFKELFYSLTEQMYIYIRYLVSQGTNYYIILTIALLPCKHIKLIK